MHFAIFPINFLSADVILDLSSSLIARVSHPYNKVGNDKAIDKLKSHKSPRIDQIPAELIKAGGRTIYLEIHKLIISIWKKEKLPEEWKESVIVPIHKKGNKQIVMIIEAYHFCQTHNFIQHPAVKVNSICEGNYRGSSMWLSTQQVDS